MIIRTRSYARAGLIGNPSDGYNGKTIAFTFADFFAEITLYQTPELELAPGERDGNRSNSLPELAAQIRRVGYYGGLRLLKASLKKFHDYCSQHAIELDDRNFTMRYRSNIPEQVGLAGSSAIITACMRAMMAFYDIEIPKPALANLVLSVETEELGIAAGLQDRVAQAYEGLIYMDFDKALMERQGFGDYQALDMASLPPLYIAYLADWGEESGIFHNDVRGRYMRGDPEVMEAMQYWADLAVQVRDLLRQGQGRAIGPLMDANFDRRKRLYAIRPNNLRMVEAARSAGASAKFTGSGGAIVGVYEDDAMYARLEKALVAVGARVLKPHPIKEHA